MNLTRILKSPWLYAIPAGALNLFAQDVIQQTLQRSIPRWSPGPTSS